MVFQPAFRFLIIAIGGPLMLFSLTGHAAALLTIDADHQYDYAQTRLDEGAFDVAIVAFNRFIYFFPADPRIPLARKGTGMAQFGAGRYQAAAAVFNALTADYQGSSLQIDAFFMLSRSHFRLGMTEQAMVDLHNLMALSPEAHVIDRACYELGWLHVEQGRWNDAAQTFGQISPDNQDRLRVADLTRTLARSDTIPVKNPTTAGLLSIVPGGGQLYTGRTQDALTAFLINAGLICAAWESFDNELYALGAVIGFVEFGFYAGNIYGAVSSAHKYNRDRIAEFRDALNRRRQTTLSLAPVPNGALLSLTIDF